MDFALFLLLNATLFIRPAEIVPDLIGLPIYNVIILLNLIFASGKVVSRLSVRTFALEPITSCVFAFWIAIIFSHLSHVNVRSAFDSGFEFSKIIIYYLLLVSVLDSTRKLRTFLIALVHFITILTGLALLHYYQWINIPSLDSYDEYRFDAQSGESNYWLRLCSTGIYHDPNDLSLVLILGICLSLYFLGSRPVTLMQPFWIVPTGIFLYALTLTHSRGGFLALLGGTVAFFYSRFGLKKAALLLGIVLPAMLVGFAGRQTDISAGDDTGQARIQLWVSGYTMIAGSPIFGVGQNLYAEHAGQVAHNSYVHAFAETGFLGGSFFLGAFVYAIITLFRLKPNESSIVDVEFRRLRSYLLAIVLSYSVGMFSLSRNYVVPTYMILGIVTAYCRLATIERPSLAGPGKTIDTVTPSTICQMFLAGFMFLLITNVFIKFFVRWG